MNAKQITQFLHSRGSAVTAILLMAAAVLATFVMGKVAPVEGNRGILFPSPNLWIADRALSLGVNLALVAGLSVCCILINRTFNIMRAQTSIWATFFLFLTLGTPSLAGQFYGGTLVCAVLVGVTAMLFTCYGDAGQTRRIFLMFFLLTVVSLVQYAAMFYILVLVLGLAQMRVLNFRSIVAAGIGIVTPLWIIFGMGLASIDDIKWPEFIGTLSSLDKTGMLITFSAIGLTAALGISAMCGVLMKVLSYNAKYRSCNGFWSILMLATIVFMLVDFNNLAIYVPVLNITVAYHLAHFFSNHRHPRSFIPIVSIICVYAGIYVCSFLFS